MTLRAALARIAAQEDFNFLLTNRIPRRLLTRFVGWFSRIETPWVRDLSIATWRLFADLDLSDARTHEFRSLHHCFVRELKEGARPLHPDPAALVSPCDAIVGACGAVSGTRVFQIKGFPYDLSDLLGDADRAERYRDGAYATLRLTSAMYHRFHAPADGRVSALTYMSGDTWNVNPIALKRIEALFCKNERAALELTLSGSGDVVTLVAVAAILVASLRFSFLPDGFDLRGGGPRRLLCDAGTAKGRELGWFEHGSTIVVLAPPGYRLWEGIAEGRPIRMGEPLMRIPDRERPSDEACA